MNMRLLIATSNPGKAREFRQMLGDERFEWLDLSSHPHIEPVEETGSTFRANACLKASHYAKAANAWALADDSGLAVDSLGGKPGVHSARWAAMHNDGEGDEANNALLLRQLREHSHPRAARFVCVLALADPRGRVMLTTYGEVEGEIIDNPRGTNGFGYDPLFFVPALGKTTAELSPDEKHAISHRGKALRRMRELIVDCGMLIVER